VESDKTENVLRDRCSEKKVLHMSVNNDDKKEPKDAQELKLTGNRIQYSIDRTETILMDIM
jgi:hypothetical protein